MLNTTLCSSLHVHFFFLEHVFSAMGDWFQPFCGHWLWIRFMNAKKQPETSQNLQKVLFWVKHLDSEMQIHLSTVISTVHFGIICLISWMSIEHFLQNYIFTFTTSTQAICYNIEMFQHLYYIYLLCMLHTNCALLLSGIYFFFRDKE